MGWTRSSCLPGQGNHPFPRKARRSSTGEHPVPGKHPTATPPARQTQTEKPRDTRCSQTFPFETTTTTRTPDGPPPPPPPLPPPPPPPKLPPPRWTRNGNSADLSGAEYSSDYTGDGPSTRTGKSSTPTDLSNDGKDTDTDEDSGESIAKRKATRKKTTPARRHRSPTPPRQKRPARTKKTSRPKAKKSTKKKPRKPREPPGSARHVISRILGYDIRQDDVYYKIRWCGYGQDGDTYEPWFNIWDHANCRKRLDVHKELDLQPPEAAADECKCAHCLPLNQAAAEAEHKEQAARPRDMPPPQRPPPSLAPEPAPQQLGDRPRAPVEPELDERDFDTAHDFMQTHGGRNPTFEPLDHQRINEDFVTTAASLLPTIAAIHLQARPISRLPPTKRWTTNLRKEWHASLSALAPMIERATDAWARDRNASLLTEALVAILALPGHVVVPSSNLRPTDGTFFVHNDPTIDTDFEVTVTAPAGQVRDPRYNRHLAQPDPPAAQAGGDPLTRRVVALARRDRMTQANKTLFSNGIAPATEETAQLMKEMHLDYCSDLKHHDAHEDAPLLTIAAKDCERALVNAAGKAPKQPDLYGWTNDMLWGLRTPKRHQEHPFTKALAKLQVLLATGDVPMAVRVLCTAGKLVAVNKVTHDENLARLARGEKPKVRPVNAGAQILKNPLRLATRTESGLRLRRHLEHTGQLGLGVSAGPEKVAFAATAHHLDGGLIDKQDVVNAFNALKRQAALDATDELWPESNALMTAYYGIPSLTLYHYERDDQHHIAVILGREGVRMGCVLGSLVYNTAQEHHVLGPLRCKHPDVQVRSLTDDAIPHFLPPENNQTWQDVHEEAVDFWRDFDALANPIGLVRSSEKGELLLPEDAPDPTGEAALKLSKTTREGVIVGGIPIGKPSFITEYAFSCFKTTEIKLTAIKKLANDDLQIAIRLLISSVNRQFDYLARATRPGPLEDLISTFDHAIQKTLLECLYPDQPDGPECHQTRRNRAISIATLNTNAGGFALTPLQVKAPAAYLAALSAALHDSYLHEIRHHLATDAAHAHANLMEILGPNKNLARGVLSFNPRDLNSQAFALRPTAPLQKKPRAGVQSRLTAIAMDRRTKELRETTTSQVGEAHTTKSDAIQTLLVTSSRSLTPRIFTASLFPGRNRASTSPLSAFLRYYLMLPPPVLQSEAESRPELDYRYKPCPIHGKPIDATGDHAAACPTTRGAIYRVHNRIRNYLGREAQRLQLDTQVEPQTASLLLQQFSPEQCRAMFPKNSTRNTRSHAKLVADALDEIPHLPAEQRDAATRKLTKLIEQTPANETGLRIDLAIGDAWIDVGVTHPTKQSTRDKTIRFLTAEAHSPQNELETPPVADYGKKKHDKYQPLINRARLQKQQRKRKTEPTFYAAIFSHLGEFSTQALRLIESLALRTRTLTQAGCQITHTQIPTRASAEHRNQLKDAIVATLVEGYGHVLEAMDCTAAA